MKKILLSMAMLLVAHVASAQFVVGGQVGFTSYCGSETTLTKIYNTTTEYTIPYDSETILLLAPKVGYQLTEQMQLGIVLNYTHERVNMHSVFDGYYFRNPEFEGNWILRGNALAIAPYLRYDFAHFGKFTAFVEAQASLGFVFKPAITIRTTGLEQNIDTTFKTDTKLFSFGFSVVPGLNYKFSERISMDLYLDIVSLGYQYNSITEQEVLEPNPGPGVLEPGSQESRYRESSFYFGANLNAQTLSDHLGFCRLGFNFHF